MVGTETLEFLNRFHVDRAVIGATGLSEEGPSETLRGFAAVKRVMLRRSAKRHLLIGSEKFGRNGLSRVGALEVLDSIIVDRRPKGDLRSALEGAGTKILVADKA